MLLYVKEKGRLWKLNLRIVYFQAKKSSGRLIIHLEPGPIVSDCLLYIVLNLVHIVMRKRDAL